MRNGYPDAVEGAAANALLNRGWGMPRQTVEVEADLKPVEQMTLAEVEAELARLEAIAGLSSRAGTRRGP